MLARLVPLLTVKYEATSIYLAKPSAKTGSSGKPLSWAACLFLGQPLLASLCRLWQCGLYPGQEQGLPRVTRDASIFILKPF